MSLKERFTNAWNAFNTDERRRAKIHEDEVDYDGFSISSYGRQDRYRMRFGSERTIINSIYNRIANDVASVTIQHVRVDENDRYLETMNSGLNECITLSANLDQTARDFWIDVVLSMLDEGVVGVVPVDTNVDIVRNNSFDIASLRTGRIVEWRPSQVLIEVYNEQNGKKQELLSWQQGNPCHSVKGQAVVFSPKERAKISTGKYAPLTPFPLPCWSRTITNDIHCT